MNISFYIISVSLVLILIFPAYSQDDTITLDQAIQYAIENNPEIKSFENNVDLANEDIDFARSGFHPNVTSSATINHVQADNDLINDWQSDTEKSIALNVTQPLYTGGQTIADINEQKSLKNVTSNLQNDLTQRIVLDTVNAYMAVYRAKEALNVNVKNIELLSDEREATQARFDAGELTKTDVSQAEARLSQAKALEADARASLQTARSNFDKVTTYNNATGFIYPDLDLAAVPQSVDEAILTGLENNPLMMAAKNQIQAEDFNMKQQKAAFLPSVDLNAGLSFQRDPAFSQIDRQESASAGITANLPLYQSGILRNQLRQSKILKSRAMDDLEVERRNVTDLIISAWENYQSIQIQIQARQAQLDAAELAYRGVQLEEEVGARSILDVLDANQDVLDAQLALIEAKTDKVNLHYALLRAIGILG